MTTSSTWIIACKGQKRWFDLDAVRVPVRPEEWAKAGQQSGESFGGTAAKGDGYKHERTRQPDPAGAPPLDWHSDLSDPAGHIRIADEWQSLARSALELDGLPRKIVLSMCPWAVCTVCGTARERVVGVAEYVRKNGSKLDHDGTGFHEHLNDATRGRAQTPTGRDMSMVRTAPTLAWTDCGHDSFRPGLVYDPAAGVLLHRTSEDGMTLRYIVGDTSDITATIPDGSVDLIFTSPPFLALRSYLPADHPDKHREIGSEPNPAAFLDVLLELTAEWGRVLAPHGTLAVELGDTYSGSGGAGGDYTNVDGFHEGQPKFRQQKSDAWPLAKSLACIPQLYMIGLAYGINPLTGERSPAGRWRVRNWLAWHRPNPPVGALGDKWRPASSYITVACKGAKRWFDLDAVREEYAESTAARNAPHRTPGLYGDKKSRSMKAATLTHAGAPPLDWHTDGDLGVGHIILSTQPYPGSHYATFPVDLPRKIIDCMCPRQVCTVCGVARERLIEATYTPLEVPELNNAESKASADYVGQQRAQNAQGMPFGRATKNVETLGWSDCGHDSWRPGIVYDPFAGSGTTLEAAQDLGRDGLGADLDARNAELARQRVGLFLEIETLPVEESA